MKIIIFLALAGLSLATETCVPPNTVSNPVVCLQTGLKELSQFLPALAKFLCHYYGTIDYNEDNYNKAFRELIEVMKCAGCAVNELLGFDDATVERILQEGGEALKDLAKNVVLKLTDTLGITEPVARLLCQLLGGALRSDCAQRLLANITPTLLKKLFCQGSRDVTAGEVADLLRTGGCFADDLVGTGDELETLLGNLGLTIDELVASLLNTIRGILLLLSPLLCGLSIG